MNYRAASLLWLLQRASAMVLAVCVVVHLCTIIYAVQGGLTAAEILGRTRGSVGWLVFYSVFVAAVTLHVPIGLRAILIEWLRWRGASCDFFLLVLAGILGLGGMRAVLALFA